MRLAIHQPNFLPRLKVLQKIAAADAWVILDSVQYAPAEWQNRARLRPVASLVAPFWLTLPVNRPQGRTTAISAVRVQDADYALSQCERSIWHACRSSSYWKEVSSYWDEVRSSVVSDALTEIASATAQIALAKFGRVPGQMVRSSQIAVTGQRSQLMARICQHLKAKEYLADSGARAYLQIADFHGTTVVWQAWTEPNDLPGVAWRDLSFLSYLAQCGPGRLEQHLLGGVFAAN